MQCLLKATKAVTFPGKPGPLSGFLNAHVLTGRQQRCDC
jgi:hypothetical protein